MSQLREHWEDTSTKVQTRRNQIDELLVDNQQVPILSSHFGSLQRGKIKFYAIVIFIYNANKFH